jgi:hypothetical protein
MTIFFNPFYYYIFVLIYATWKEKTKFHGTRHCISSFFCQKTWDENNVWMLQNMTPLKTDITELSINKKHRCIYVHLECYFLKKWRVRSTLSVKCDKWKAAFSPNFARRTVLRTGPQVHWTFLTCNGLRNKFLYYWYYITIHPIQTCFHERNIYAEEKLTSVTAIHLKERQLHIPT